MMDEEIGRVELSKKLSDISRNSGKVTFKITYTNTEGNSEIDKSFQEFCYKYANNEYLAGLSLLLKSFKHYQELGAMDAVFKTLDQRVTLLEEFIDKVKKGVEEEKEEVESEEKTF